MSVQVPLSNDLAAVVEALRREASAEREAQVDVTDIAGNATIVVRAWAPDAAAAERLESDLRLRLHARLRADGFYA